MENEEMKNSSFDSSSLEEIQPLLEELEEKVVENNESSDVSFSNGMKKTITTKTITTKTIRRGSLKDDSDLVEAKKEVELIETPKTSDEPVPVQNTVDETPVEDTPAVLASDVVLDDAEVENNTSTTTNTTNTTTTTNAMSTTSTTTNLTNMTNMTNSVVDAGNSTVNIDTNTINVSATSVVLSCPKDEEAPKRAPVDYSRINSRKGELELSTAEHVIREYRITKGGGKAIVTNKRFVVDCKTRLDLPIEKVAGVASSSHLLIKSASLVFGIIFLILCAVGEYFGNSSLIPYAWAQYTLMAVGGVFGLIGLIMVICAFEKKFTLNIFGEGILPVMVVSRKLRDAKDGLQGVTIDGRKGKDFAKFTGEIGAILVEAKEDLKRN